MLRTEPFEAFGNVLSYTYGSPDKKTPQKRRLGVQVI